MIADDADETSTATEQAADTATAEAPPAEDTATEEPAIEQAEEAASPEQAAEPAAEAEEEPAAEPVADPASCKGIAIGMDAFQESVLDGEWEGSELEYYLEPAGVLHGPLQCTRAAEDQPTRGGLLMTRAAWKAKTVYLDDGINPEVYELSFPKEFGYVKPVSHYVPETREHAKYPWTKKY